MHDNRRDCFISLFQKHRRDCFRNKAALIFPSVLVSSLFAILDTVIVLDLAYLFFNFQIPLFFYFFGWGDFNLKIVFVSCE